MQSIMLGLVAWRWENAPRYQNGMKQTLLMSNLFGTVSNYDPAFLKVAFQ